MPVRRHIYLRELEARLLAEESQRSGLSVSELIRLAIRQCYRGREPKLPWDEVFAHPLKVGSAGDDPPVGDSLFDHRWDELADRVLGKQKP